MFFLIDSRTTHLCTITYDLAITNETEKYIDMHYIVVISYVCVCVALGGGTKSHHHQSPERERETGLGAGKKYGTQNQKRRRERERERQTSIRGRQGAMPYMLWLLYASVCVCVLYAKEVVPSSNSGRGSLFFFI